MRCRGLFWTLFSVFQKPRYSLHVTPSPSVLFREALVSQLLRPLHSYALDCCCAFSHFRFAQNYIPSQNSDLYPGKTFHRWNNTSVRFRCQIEATAWTLCLTTKIVENNELAFWKNHILFLLVISLRQFFFFVAAVFQRFRSTSTFSNENNSDDARRSRLRLWNFWRQGAKRRISHSKTKKCKMRYLCFCFIIIYV